MSLGFLTDDDTPVIWRGPIVMGVVKKFLQDVEWGDLDYLMIDLPPGTGDAQLTLAQTVPITGAIIVTTPSRLALVDAEKGLRDVRGSGGAGARHHREHEHVRLSPLRQGDADLRLRRRREDLGEDFGGSSRSDPARSEGPRGRRQGRAHRQGGRTARRSRRRFSISPTGSSSGTPWRRGSEPRGKRTTRRAVRAPHCAVDRTENSAGDPTRKV